MRHVWSGIHWRANEAMIYKKAHKLRHRLKSLIYLRHIRPPPFDNERENDLRYGNVKEPQHLVQEELLFSSVVATLSMLSVQSDPTMDDLVHTLP